MRQINPMDKFIFPVFLIQKIFRIMVNLNRLFVVRTMYGKGISFGL